MQEQLWLVIGPPSTSFSTVIFSIVPSKSGHNIKLSVAPLHSDSLKVSTHSCLPISQQQSHVGGDHHRALTMNPTPNAKPLTARCGAPELTLL